MPDNDPARDPGATPPTILLTRPAAQAARFAESLRAEGIDRIVIAPLQAIEPVGDPPHLPHGAHVIFTSANAVAFAPPGAGRKAICVGARTAEAATARGYVAEVAGGTADALVAHLISAAPTAPLIHLHGRHVRGDIAARLSAAGMSATAAVIYDQIALPPSAAFHAACAQPRVIVPLFSPRSAQLFAHACPRPGPGATAIALSENVNAALPEAWQDRTVVTAAPTAAAMRAEITRSICHGKRTA